MPEISRFFGIVIGMFTEVSTITRSSMRTVQTIRRYMRLMMRLR